MAIIDLKQKILKYIFKRRVKKMNKELDKIISKREKKQFKKMEKDPKSFWFNG